MSKNGAVSKGSADADGNPDSYGYSAATGCGPSAAGNTGSYAVSTKLDKDTIESDLACGSADKAYNGKTGTKASTTNTVYGVYDIAGGVSEHVMGSRTSSTTESDSSKYMSKAAVPPYVDLYVIKPNGPFYDKPDWSSNPNESWYNYDICTFETCGGTATYETTTVQSVSGDYQSWGGAYSRFLYKYNPLFYRGSDSSDSYTSPFYTYRSTGSNSTDFGSRAALLALPAGQ